MSYNEYVYKYTYQHTLKEMQFMNNMHESSNEFGLFPLFIFAILFCIVAIFRGDEKKQLELLISKELDLTDSIKLNPKDVEIKRNSDSKLNPKDVEIKRNSDSKLNPKDVENPYEDDSDVTSDLWDNDWEPYRSKIYGLSAKNLCSICRKLGININDHRSTDSRKVRKRQNALAKEVYEFLVNENKPPQFRLNQLIN